MAFWKRNKPEPQKVPPPQEYHIGEMTVSLRFGEYEGHVTISITGGTEGDRATLSTALHTGLQKEHHYHYQTSTLDDDKDEIHINPPEGRSHSPKPPLTEARIKEVLEIMAEAMPTREAFEERVAEFRLRVERREPEPGSTTRFKRDPGLPGR